MIRRVVRAFGVGIAIHSDAPDLFDILEPQLPVFPLVEEADPVLSYQIKVRTTGGVAVLRGRRTLALVQDVPAASIALVADLQSAVARKAAGYTFVHAGVVEIDGRALVLPARSHGGKSTLVAALIRHGAGYGSDEFAVIDRAGRVHPYARPLALRTASGMTRVRAADLGGSVVARALPAGAVVFTGFSAGADLSPVPASKGEIVLGLLRHCLGVRGRPAETMSALRAVAADAAGFSSPRGEADATAGALIAMMRESRPPI